LRNSDNYSHRKAQCQWISKDFHPS